MARVEELRNGFVSPNLRAAFLATQHRAYSLVIDLLMDRNVDDPGTGHDRKALAVSERARARRLLDVLQSGRVVHAGGTVPAGLIEQRQSLRRRLSAKADQQLKQSGARAEALGRESEKLLAELDSVEAEIRRLDLRYAEAAAPSTLDAQEIATLLDPCTLLLEYSLGEEHSYLWVVGERTFQSFVLPPEKEIDALARRLYEDTSTQEAGTGRRIDAAESLSRILVGPVWSELERGHRLVVIPDAALHIVPFAALPSPGSGERLLDRLEIAYMPSATTLALQRQRLEQRLPAPKWAAVLADPVFTPDDPRLVSLSGDRDLGRTSVRSEVERSAQGTAPLSALERLPSTRREAATIAALAPAGRVWTALDLSASREAALSGNLRDARVIHFATHGLADLRLLLLVAVVGGGFEVKELKVPKVGRGSRLVSCLFGLLFVALGFTPAIAGVLPQLQLAPPPAQPAAMQTTVTESRPAAPSTRAPQPDLRSTTEPPSKPQASKTAKRAQRITASPETEKRSLKDRVQGKYRRIKDAIW